MKKMYTTVFRFLFVSAFLLFQFTSAKAQTLAFPGAEGFGKYATGGRTGTVYHVTNLNNSGVGSLRDAVSAPNRIVVFDVAGVIKITDRIVVSANIYLAGQTAPGEGITVYGNGWSFSNANNTICRYMKIRMGIVGTSGKDANGIADGHDFIFDHCSVSWGRDENFSINGSASNITIQNCMITQGLMTHSAGGLIQTDGGVTLYRNLYADNGTRNNKIKGVNQYVNNMVYNWSAGAYIMGGDSEGDTYANAVSNLFIQGPVDGVRPFSTGNLRYHLYENDNIQDGNRNGVLDPTVIPHNEFGDGPDFQTVPYNYPVLPTVAANTLISNNLPFVGASLPYRDYVDYYVANEVKSFGKKGALIANESVLPFGAPNTWTLWPGNPRTDTDNDGIPDAWEINNGLNPNLASDAMIITSDGYTNIEHYINSITAANSQEYLRAPLSLKADSATQSSISFSWFDYTEKELGYIFERKINNAWVAIDTTGVNENYFTLTGLQPEEKDTFRVRAYNATMLSGYSNELIARSKPIEVPVIDPATFVPDITWTGAVNTAWDKTTNNWKNNASAPVLFTDSSKLLFPTTATAQTINLTAQMGPKDILVNDSSDYTFSGSGFIAGTGSMNKTGTGKLSLLTNNTYTGATVLRKGTLEFNKLVNGGLPSAIGASPNYAFNWVWKGGKLAYTGPTTSTDRNATIDESTEFSVTEAAATVTMTGIISGAGGLTKSGPGRLLLRSANPYEGETVIKGGILEVTPVNSNVLDSNIINNAVAIGSSGVLRLQGGTYRTTGGSNTDYENYPFTMYVQDSTTSGFEPNRLANLGMTVLGNGTLNYAIPYLRELIQGDWSGFTGTLVANGVWTGEPSLLIFDNHTGLPSSRVITAGNTKIVNWNNNETVYLGGLSGPAGTQLSCGGTKTVSFGRGYTTWSVGAAGTDETFNGVINNQLYGATTNTDGETTIIKEGSGIWRLTGTNSYSGTTTVTDGSFIINGSNTGTGKTTVTGGILAGKGSISSDVEVQNGMLQPGDSSISTFTLKAKLTLQAGSTVNVQINKTANTFDKISVLGTLAYNGTLQVDTTGSFAAGDVFKIFIPTGAVSGNFTTIIPATPGAGLLWRFKPATGELMVVTPGFVEVPTNLALTAATNAATSTSTITATWTDNSDNELYFVLERSLDSLSFTDIAHPAANATTYTDSNRIPNTKYYYRIKAVGSTQQSVYSVIKSITTPALYTPPAVPSNPIPANNAQDVVINSGNLNLSWTGSSNTTSYSVYFGTDSTNLVKLADVPYSATPTYAVTGLTNFTQYFWRINAMNAIDTTTGILWNFRTALAPAITGDYRAIKTGYYDSVVVSTGLADIWETFNGTTWVPATTAPSSSVNTVTIKSGFTVSLRGTTQVKNLVIENGATLKSFSSNRNLRVSNSIINNGSLGTTTAAERVNFEGYLTNGTITLTGNGAGKYYFVNLTVNNIAVVTEVVIDADLNLSGYMRGNYSNSTSGVNTAGQDDDSITITINTGRTVTMGNSSVLQEGSVTTNTITNFGKYIYDINGTLDMRTTSTSCIIAHSTKANSNITINVNGTWLTGNAMRFASTATTVPAGTMNANVGNNGVVDAGARTINTSSAVTNMVFYNAVSGQYFYNMTGNGVLKNKIGNTEITYPIGTNNTYSPVKLTNSGTADIIAVGVKNTFDNPVPNSNYVVNKQFNITPTTSNVVNLAIALGWLPADQASGFSVNNPMVVGHWGGTAWDLTSAVFSGAGTIASPYYAKAFGFTSFSPFIVANASMGLPLTLLSFSGSYNGKKTDLLWSTTNEINIRNFSIERSSNGIAFTSIGTVDAKNGTSRMDYAFADQSPLAGLSYYRLKIIEKDGTSRYSKIVTINTALIHSFSLYPNPATSNVNVMHGMITKPTTLQLYTLDGKLITTMTLATGTTQTNLDINQLPKGYYLIAINDGSVSTLVFSKQ